MSRLAVINGKLIDVSQGIIETRNLFFKNGIVVGLGYVADEKEEGQDVLDLNKAHMFPEPCNLGLNVLEMGDVSMARLISLGVSSVVFWPTETMSLDTVSDFNDVLMRYNDVCLNCYGLASLTEDGHALTDLVGLSRAGAVGFYQDAAVLDLEVFEEALPILVQLESTLFLDITQMTQIEEELVVSLIDVMKGYPDLSIHLMSLQTPKSLPILKHARTQNIQISAAVNLPDLLRFSVADREVFIDAINDGTLSLLTHNEPGVSMPTIIDIAMKDLGLDSITVAKLVGGNILRLLGKKRSLFSLQSRPSFLALSIDSGGGTASEIVKTFVNGIPLEIGV